MAPRTFLGALRSFLGRLLSGAHFGEHIDDDEIREYAGRLFAQPPCITSMPATPHDIAVEQILRVFGPHWIRIVGFQGVRDVTDARALPRLVLLALHHEAQIVLGGVWILAILIDGSRENEHAAHFLADGANR